MREYKICVLGGGGVGKSACTVRFVHSIFVEIYDPTIEDIHTKIITLDSMTVKIEIVDTAGQENISSLHSSYITSGDGFLLVFSLTSLESLNELQNIRESIYRIKEAENRNGKKVPLVLVGNKCDIFSERQVPREVAIALATNWGDEVPYYETSAKKEINIQACFEDVVRQMIKAGVGREEKVKKRKSKCVLM